MDEVIDPDIEAHLLYEKDRWAQNLAEELSAVFSMEIESALACARSAVLWVDEFKDRKDETQPGSRQELKELLAQTRDDARSRSTGLPRYPGGALTLKAIAASDYAFCRAFPPEERDYVKELLAERV